MTWSSRAGRSAVPKVLYGIAVLGVLLWTDSAFTQGQSQEPVIRASSVFASGFYLLGDQGNVIGELTVLDGSPYFALQKGKSQVAFSVTDTTVFFMLSTDPDRRGSSSLSGIWVFLDSANTDIDLNKGKTKVSFDQRETVLNTSFAVDADDSSGSVYTTIMPNLATIFVHSTDMAGVSVQSTDSNRLRKPPIPNHLRKFFGEDFLVQEPVCSKEISCRRK